MGTFSKKYDIRSEFQGSYKCHKSWSYEIYRNRAQFLETCRVGILVHSFLCVCLNVKVQVKDNTLFYCFSISPK